MKHRNPIPTVDVIIEYTNGKKQGIVLIERKFEPYGLAIPGGHAELGLSLEQNAVKEAKEETGLDIKILNPEKPFRVHSSPDRDPRGHYLTCVYIAKGGGILKAGDDAKKAGIYTYMEVLDLIKQKKLVFDHDRILLYYLVHQGFTSLKIIQNKEIGRLL